MDLQLSVDQFAEYVSAGIRTRATANLTEYNSGPFTGQSVKELLATSCHADDKGSGIQSAEMRVRDVSAKRGGKDRQTMNEKKLLYNVSEAAERLGLPISKVRQLAKTGALGCRRIGKYLRFAEEDLRAFVEQAKAA